MDKLIQELPSGEMIFIKGDLNDHVGKENRGFERVHGGQGYGVRNESRCYSKPCNNLWFHFNEHLIQEEELAFNHLQEWDKC